MGPVTTTIKRFLPKSLLGRSLMIIVTPLIVLQLVSAAIFYETHWDKVTFRLARGVAGDIATVISLMQRHPAAEDREWIFHIAANNMELSAVLEVDAVLPNIRQTYDGLIEETLAQAMENFVGRPFRIDSQSLEREIIVDVQLANGVLRVVTPRKRLFSSTAYVFVIWMVGTSLILFALATVFMRNQVKPIRRLAVAADNFGKGRDVSSFKPEGAASSRCWATPRARRS